ncbi:MAG: hypothetical protein JAY74_03665 [Candidatus Thiodiazotropha taylori]|nr:hypothetical protein [Candidatus Thiodiazotropha taylori]
MIYRVSLQKTNETGDLVNVTVSRKKEEATLYTLADLEAAKEELSQWQIRWDSYSGNNPDKYQSDLKIALQKVRLIESSLKESGELSLTPQEELEISLDKEFPNARSKQIVSFQGKQYQRKFWPLERSRSGKTITEWGKGWVEVCE